MAKLISVPSSPPKYKAEPHLVCQGPLTPLVTMYEEWQVQFWDGHWAEAERPRYDALILLDDEGNPICAAS